ncbi:hypothetical protein [Niveibacterium sp.]|uniref:hypothetical protein n=1 Tax=Niveibacterium sp. TaxID=2017444 RepID=UPI0035B192B5
MQFEFEFYSSEIERVESDANGLRVHFSAAYLHRSAPSGASVPGYAGKLVMRFSGARWSGEPERCIGGLADGSLSVDGLRQTRFALPLNASGSIVTEFRLISGTQLSVQATHVSCEPPAPDQFIESYAC